MSTISSPRLFKDTILYAITGIATKLIGALLLPILTRLVTPSEYGAIDIIVLGGLLIFECVLLGTDFMVALYYHDQAINPRRLIGTLVALRLGMGSIAALLLVLVAPWLQHWGLPSATQSSITAIRVAALTLPASGLVSLWIMLMRQQGRSGWLLLLTFMRVVCTGGLTVSLLWHATDPISAYFWAIFWVDIAFALLLTTLFRSQIGRIQKSLAKQLILKGSAFLPRSIYFVLMALITRQILLHFSSPDSAADAVGQYAMATKISFIVWILINSSSYAWLSYSLSISHQPEAPRIYSKYLLNYLSVMGLMVVGVALFAADILRILTTSAYVVAAPAVGWQTLSLLAAGSVVIVSTGLNITKDTAIIGRTTMLAGLVNIGLAMILIPIGGMLGAAIAAAIDQGLAVFFLYRASQKRYPLPFASTEIVGWIGFIISLVSIASLLPTESTIELFLVKVTLIMLYTIILIKRGHTQFIFELLHRFKRSKYPQSSQPSEI